jgi:predicted nucleic acid-binding protein
MALIVDASVAGSWAMPDERRDEATAIGRRVLAEGARAPDLFWHEIRNLLVLGVRRKRLTEEEFWRQFERIERMPIRTAPTASSRRIAAFALKHGLTAYDAAYLDLAVDLKLPLASFDDKLRAAAKAEGVELLPDAP